MMADRQPDMQPDNFNFQYKMFFFNGSFFSLKEILTNHQKPARNLQKYVYKMNKL